MKKEDIRRFLRNQIWQKQKKKLQLNSQKQLVLKWSHCKKSTQRNMQKNWYNYSSILSSNKPKLDEWLVVDLAEFPCSYLNLPGVNKKLFCKQKQNNFRFTIGKNSENQINQQTITCHGRGVYRILILQGVYLWF